MGLRGTGWPAEPFECRASSQRIACVGRSAHSAGFRLRLPLLPASHLFLLVQRVAASGHHSLLALAPVAALELVADEQPLDVRRGKRGQRGGSGRGRRQRHAVHEPRQRAGQPDHAHEPDDERRRGMAAALEPDGNACLRNQHVLVPLRDCLRGPRRRERRALVPALPRTLLNAAAPAGRIPMPVLDVQHLRFACAAALYWLL